jgi:aryl-alcohol dehydrogenase-like predicted oxidoreductase
MDVLDRILIGLANTNPNYGVQTRGNLTAQTLQEIWSAGVTRVDSATDYLHADKVISESNLNWRIQTKFKLPESYNSFEDLLRAAKLATSNSQVECLLIHTPNLYQNRGADNIVLDLKRVSEVLEIPRVGISIYRPHELENLKNWKDLDLVQFPHNPLDSNCLDWLSALERQKFPILQVRSIYLQGLLIPEVTKSSALPDNLLEILSGWEEWTIDSDLDAQMYCAAFAFGNPTIDEIVVGVDSVKQFKQLIRNIVDATDLPRYPKVIPEEFTDPRRWTH